MSECNNSAIRLPLCKWYISNLPCYIDPVVGANGRLPDGSLAGSSLHSGDTMINLDYNVKQKYLISVVP